MNHKKRKVMATESTDTELVQASRCYGAVYNDLLIPAYSHEKLASITNKAAELFCHLQRMMLYSHAGGNTSRCWSRRSRLADLPWGHHALCCVVVQHQGP